MTIRDFLNRIFWDPRENRANYEVIFIHRGAYMDRKSLPCVAIKEVKSSWFTYETPEEGEVVIPFHRIIEIRNLKTGEAAWKRQKKNPKPEPAAQP